MFKFNNINSRIKCDIYSKSTTEAPDIDLVSLFFNFEYILHVFLVLYVTTINNSFLPLTTFFPHKLLHSKCCIKVELSIVTWSRKILIGFRKDGGAYTMKFYYYTMKFCLWLDANRNLKFIQSFEVGKVRFTWAGPNWCKMVS